MKFLVNKSVLDLLVLVFFIVVGFFITSPWFDKYCSSTTHGDLESHFYTSFIIREQITKYHKIYPISFDYSPLGYYWFSYSSLPFYIPSLLQFLNPRIAFLVVYTLFYSFGGFFLYLFLRINKGKLFNSIFLSTLFLFSAFVNQQFTVHGSYHTIAIIPFFMLSLIYLQKCSSSITRSNVFFFTVFSFLTMLMHFSMIIILPLFVCFYVLFTKKFKLIIPFIFSILITFSYYLPLGMHSLIISSSKQAIPYSGLDSFIKVFSSIMYIPHIDDAGLTANNDFFYGPFYLICFIFAVLYSFIRIKNNKIVIKIKSEDQTRLLLIFAFSVFIFSLLWSFVGFIHGFLAEDRIPFFLELGLALFIASVFSKMDINSFYLLIMLIIILFVKPSIFVIILLILVSISCILPIIKIYRTKTLELKFNLTLLPSIFLLVLLLPFLGVLGNTLYYTRVWCTFLPPSILLNQSVTLLSQGYDNFIYTLPYLTGVNLANSVNIKTTLFMDIPEKNDLNLNDFIYRAGVNLFVFNIFTNADFNSKNISFYIRGFPAALSANNFVLIPVNYTINFINPVNAHVSVSDVDNVYLRIYYHPWWRAFNGSHYFNISRDEWFLRINDLSGYSGFNLTFDTFFFDLGNLISVLAFFALLFVLYRFY